MKNGTQCYIAKLPPLKLLLTLYKEAENQTDYAPTPELPASFEDELFEDLDVDEKYNPYLTSKEDEDEGGSRDEKESGKWER